MVCSNSFANNINSRSHRVCFFTQKEGLGVPWQGAWLLLTIVTAFNIFLVSVLSVAEGSGLITDVNKMRMYQSLLAGILAVSLLISGFGLYATSAIAISGTIIFSIFSYKYFKKFSCNL